MIICLINKVFDLYLEICEIGFIVNFFRLFQVVCDIYCVKLWMYFLDDSEWVVSLEEFQYVICLSFFVDFL